MYQLVYLSSAVELFREEELKDLLATSRLNNEKLHVTGMLLYHEGNFIQVLEGEQQLVMNLYHKIAQDNRHRGVIKLIGHPISERSFPDWSMGFKTITADRYKKVIGYLNPSKDEMLHAPEAAEDKAAISLLKIFTGTNIPNF